MPRRVTPKILVILRTAPPSPRPHSVAHHCGCSPAHIIVQPPPVGANCVLPRHTVIAGVPRRTHRRARRPRRAAFPSHQSPACAAMRINSQPCPISRLPGAPARICLGKRGAKRLGNECSRTTDGCANPPHTRGWLPPKPTTPTPRITVLKTVPLSRTRFTTCRQQLTSANPHTHSHTTRAGASRAATAASPHTPHQTYPAPTAHCLAPRTTDTKTSE